MTPFTLASAIFQQIELVTTHSLHKIFEKNPSSASFNDRRYKVTHDQWIEWMQSSDFMIY